MRILYDQQIFSFQEYGGISRYFYELAKGIKKLGNTVLIDGKYSNNLYLSKLKPNISKILPRFNFIHKNIFLFYVNRLLDCKLMNESNFDVLHATYYHPFFLKRLNGKPYIITVHDMVHELFNNMSGFTKQTLEFKKKTISKAAHIITVSNNTKRDLIRIYNIPADRITVIYHGNSFEGIKVKSIDGLPRRYLLYVGNRKGYKNFGLFIKAVSPSLNKDKNLFLVCAGGGIFSSEEKKLLSKSRIAHQVRQMGFKSDNELAYIYKNALVYILPSLYEGFGMTVLEAFSMGCPVVASNTSSIPEVCGKAAILVNPKESESITRGINKVINNEKFRKSLIKLGIVQSKKFSWEKTTEKTLNIYSRVARLQ